MIKVLGPDWLYQWDSNRQVVLLKDDISCTQVHFAHLFRDKEALVVEVKEDDEGNRVADIPNSLFISGDDIWAWTWRDDNTISGKHLQVTRRTKPSTYIYTPTEVETFEALKEWVKEELAKLKPEGINDYMNLINKPSIEGVILEGDKLLNEFGLKTITNDVIDSWFE